MRTSPYQTDHAVNPPKVLTGWKEISTYLRLSVRTAQRYESIGLPVRRIGVGPRRPVIAFAEELDAWEKAAPTHFFDVIADLKAKVYSLEIELTSLKHQLENPRAEKLATESERSKRKPRRRSTTVALSISIIGSWRSEVLDKKILSSMDNENWHDAYRLTLLEVDGQKAAGKATAGRLREIEGDSSDHREEGDGLEHALDALKAPTTETNAWQ
jgi:hypothetical protein